MNSFNGLDEWDLWIKDGVWRPESGSQKPDGTFSYDITQHTLIDGFQEYVERLKMEIDAGRIYVVEPYLPGESSLTKKDGKEKVRS